MACFIGERMYCFRFNSSYTEVKPLIQWLYFVCDCLLCLVSLHSMLERLSYDLNMNKTETTNGPE